MGMRLSQAFDHSIRINIYQSIKCVGEQKKKKKETEWNYPRDTETRRKLWTMFNSRTRHTHLQT